MKAIWKNVVIAQSDLTIVVEGNHYFPKDSVAMKYFKDSDTKTTCHWKGVASYYTIDINGEKNIDAAWYYPDPKNAANEIKGYIAFWKGVQIVND